MNCGRRYEPSAYTRSRVPRRGVHDDEVRVFLDRYAKLHKFGLSDAYEERCDFYDWPTGGRKPAIDTEGLALSRYARS
mgnify:CR=1 FL=1